MYVLKGFANHALLANNTPGTNNAIGEISAQSITYSREQGQYVNQIAPNVTLISFLSATDDTPTVIDPDLATRTLTIIEWIFNLSITTSGPIYADVFLQEILAQFQGKAENFQCGAIVNDGTHYIPEWVSWKDDVLGSDNYIKVWFADASFLSQYDEFEIVVVPPLPNLDDFFKTGAQVEALVNARDNAQMLVAFQNAKKDANGVTRPETIVRADIYNYHDPLVATHLVPTTWGTLIYGQAGNNIDSIKDALQKYILANTQHTRDEWVAIFPDIFKRTEFILVPNWASFAIPDNSAQVGIYSPIHNLAALNTLIAAYAFGYSQTHINAHATGLSHQYKSVSIGSIGSIENRDNLYELQQVFPDFIAVASTSTDFNRMSQDTQGFAELLENMLITAETMGQFTSLPAGMTRLTRNNQLFLVATYDNIHFLVAAKVNFSS
jgi:hypothetical protein